MSVQDENFKSKPTNFRLEKCLLFGVTLIPASKSLVSFTKYFYAPPPWVLPFKSTFNLWKYEHICIHFISMIELIKLFHLCVWGKNITFCGKKDTKCLNLPTFTNENQKVKRKREISKCIFHIQNSPPPSPSPPSKSVIQKVSSLYNLRIWSIKFDLTGFTWINY